MSWQAAGWWAVVCEESRGTDAGRPAAEWPVANWQRPVCGNSN